MPSFGPYGTVMGRVRAACKRPPHPRRPHPTPQIEAELHDGGLASRSPPDRFQLGPLPQSSPRPPHLVVTRQLCDVLMLPKTELLQAQLRNDICKVTAPGPRGGPCAADTLRARGSRVANDHEGRDRSRWAHFWPASRLWFGNDTCVLSPETAITLLEGGARGVHGSARSALARIQSESSTPFPFHTPSPHLSTCPGHLPSGGVTQGRVSQLGAEWGRRSEAPAQPKDT